MKKFRFILALVLVLTMVLSTPLMAMAATHEAYGSDDIYNAFETDTDDEVIINMKNDIVMDYGDTLYGNEGQNYTINGNGNTLSDVVIDGAGNVAIDADITSENNYAALIVGGEANVTVTGDVTGADGDAEYVDMENPMSGDSGALGVEAYGHASVKIEGDVTGGDGYGTTGHGGNGVTAYGGASVEVTGNVTGGDVIANPDVEASYYLGSDGEKYYSSSAGGDGVEVWDDASVTVGGNVTGGSTNGDQGDGGIGVDADDYYSYGADDNVSASVTVGGDVTGGDATNGVAGVGVYADNLSVVEVGGNVTGGDATSGFAAPGIYTENSTQITVGGDVTGGTATDGGESGAGIYAEYYGDYYEDNEEGIERGTVTVAGTVSGGEGAASIYFNAPESLAELVKEMEDLDLDAILEKDPEELTDDDYMALELALMALVSNGDLTEEELEAYGEEAGNINSIEEYMAFAQKVINAEKTQEIDLMDAFGEIGLEYSLITVGSVSKENGPAYGSNAGEQFAQKMGEKNVVETNVETPNTGDSFNPMLVLAVALVSLMGTAALVFKKKAA